ncbi:hypothetical protein [Patulibacter americanus]|uniref:hypothetical protein n=1 Tax=Patulibacter americanus TaxID=588672 RepID=UPI0003B36A89|nr:hypothetical protein [Patulibacter americanus]
MNTSNFLARLTVEALVGALFGTLVGLVLLAVGVIDNPFWLTSAGIFVAAFASTLRDDDA